ncbi:hypothetical protein niasHS_014826 [Heterodera schachtii]|uniref:Uncharacterized protein n=1 Tax=Heterodera schachtii TaxID=97005 RepID=A0ABD2IFZ8_HETSC
MAFHFLEGVKVVELVGLAPVPFCGMILADFGAEVILLVNKSSKNPLANFGLRMGQKKSAIQLEFDKENDRRKLRNICCGADVLLDPFRPGTLEAIGLGPAELTKVNPGLIVARVTGFGQSGPMSARAGHDINFVALSGLFPMLFGNSRASFPPWPPANLLADFAVGGLLTAFGVAAALFKRTKNGFVLDCAMTEGLAYLGSFLFLSRHEPWLWHEEFALFSGKCPIYRTYETADRKWMAVGAVEPKFQQKLFEILGISTEKIDGMAKLTREMENAFRGKTQGEWAVIFEGEDACVTPVLNMDEVGHYEQHKRRNAFLRGEVEGEAVWVPRAVPKRMETEKSQTKAKSERTEREKSQMRAKL